MIDDAGESDDSPEHSWGAALAPIEQPLDTDDRPVSEARARGASEAALLDRLESLLLRRGRTDHAVAVRAARVRAEDLLSARAGRHEAAASAFAAEIFVADVLGALALDSDWSREEIDALLAGAARIVRCPPELVRLAVGLRALRDPRLFGLPPHLAIETQLRMLLALAPVSEVSLWTATPVERLRCIVHFGEGTAVRRMRAEARRVLQSRPGGKRRHGGFVHGVPIVRHEQPCGALVVRGQPNDRPSAVALAEEAAALLGPMLEKATLLERSAAKEKSLVESAERRLARLGFDLHDGPIQDVVALANDVRLFKAQLARVLSTTAEDHPRMLGRVDDLEARLLALDEDLRELARSFESPALLEKPLRTVVAEEVKAFSARTDIRAELDLQGDFAALTASQRIAIIRIVQEALANVRDHSGATEVSVSIVGRRGHVRAQIVDNGRGFDVERTLVRAARTGRLGLVGMAERVRLLGGTFDVQSREGGPTTISVTLPEWHPALLEQPRRQVSTG